MWKTPAPVRFPKGPKPLLFGALVIAIEKMAEHRALQWANERVDEGAVLLIPHIQSILKAASDHFWWSLLIMVGVYCTILVGFSYLSAWFPSLTRWGEQADSPAVRLSNLVEPTQMRELPLNGRNFEQLLTLAPGVQQLTAQ